MSSSYRLPILAIRSMPIRRRSAAQAAALSIWIKTESCIRTGAASPPRKAARRLSEVGCVGSDRDYSDRRGDYASAATKCKVEYAGNSGNQGAAGHRSGGDSIRFAVTASVRRLRRTSRVSTFSAQTKVRATLAASWHRLQPVLTELG